MGSNEIIICGGLGRCGTSLMMRLLHTGGMPVFADNFASYESELANSLEYPDPKEWMAEVEGKAIKILDIHRMYLPAGYKFRMVWMERDLRQQAKSHIKFVGAMYGAGFSDHRESNVRNLMESLRSDTKKCLRKMEGLRIPVLIIKFEHLLSHPARDLAKVASFIDCPLNLEKAVQVVKVRSAACAPDIDTELNLIKLYAK